MRLVSFAGGFGRLEGDRVVPMGSDLLEWLETGDARDREPVALDALELLAPVPRPGKIICIGRNYVEHAAESGAAPTEEPALFAKFANSVAAHGATGDARLAILPARRSTHHDEESESNGARAYRCRSIAAGNRAGTTRIDPYRARAR